MAMDLDFVSKVKEVMESLYVGFNLLEKVDPKKYHLNRFPMIRREM